MSIKLKLWLGFAVIFVAPFYIYFFVNIYWWLFDGNTLVMDKVGASAWGIIVGTLILSAWADLGKVFRNWND